MSCKAFLTSSLMDDYRIPPRLCDGNLLVEKLRAVWKPDSKMLVISGHPDLHSQNDSLTVEIKLLFGKALLPLSSIEVCDSRNPEVLERVGEMDVLLLSGGFASKQHALMQRGKLVEKLADFHGIVIGFSAGSMSCAEHVCLMPKVQGTTLTFDDGDTEKCLPGLDILHGLGVLPHFRYKLEVLMPLACPVLADYFEHEIIGLDDGSWILVDGASATLYGEGYRMKDGKIECIYEHGETLELYSKREE